MFDIYPFALANKFQKYSAVKVLLTSVSPESSNNGHNLELIKLFKGGLSISIVLNGGIAYSEATAKDIENGADEVVSAYIFHFLRRTSKDIKLTLAECNIPVRLSV